jgi:hypothetical protein
MVMLALRFLAVVVTHHQHLHHKVTTAALVQDLQVVLLVEVAEVLAQLVRTVTLALMVVMAVMVPLQHFLDHQ